MLQLPIQFSFPAPVIKTVKKRITPTSISSNPAPLPFLSKPSPLSDKVSAALVPNSEGDSGSSVMLVENIDNPLLSSKQQGGQNDIAYADVKRKNKSANTCSGVSKSQKPLDFFFKNSSGAQSHSTNIKPSDVYSILTPERDKDQPHASVSDGVALSPLDFTDDVFERLAASDGGTPEVPMNELAPAPTNELSPNRLCSKGENDELFPDNLFLGSPST